MATTTILGVFETAESARYALDALRNSGLALHDTSLVTQGTEAEDKLNAPEGALVGAAWGGLVGLVALAIPGIGPFIAGGAVAAALTGAAAGAVVGGIGGALVQSTNLNEADATRYASEVEAGKTLVIVKAEEDVAYSVREILAQDGADAIHENQTDMANGGAAEVSIYNDVGMPVRHGAVVEATEAYAAAPNTTQPAVGMTYDRGVVEGRDPDFNDQQTADEVLENDNDQGTAYKNGARVVSYEEENTHEPKA